MCSIKEKHFFLEDYLNMKIPHPDDRDFDDELDHLKFLSNWIKSNEEVLKIFMYKFLYRNIENIILLNYRLDKNNIEPHENINEILSGNPEEVDKKVNEIERKISFSLPHPIMTIKNLVISITLYLCSLMFIIYVFSLQPALFSAFPIILLSILFILTAGIPGLILLLIDPNFYRPKSFFRVKTFHDFINQATLTNLLYVQKKENDYVEKELNSILKGII